MYGKFFASTFTGSMMASGAEVFAVWGYVIANTAKGHVELNPRLLAAVIGMPKEAVERAIDKLCQPDPDSRSHDKDGRRLVKEGEYMYLVVNHERYRNIRNEEERREYNREKKREERKRIAARKGKPAANGQEMSTGQGMSNDVSLTVNDLSNCQPRSAHTEAEGEAEKERNGGEYSESVCTTSKKSRTKATKKCPKDFAVTDSLRQWASDKFPGVNVDEETERMKDYTYLRAMNDWDGAWRNWIRKASEFSRTQHVAHERRASNGHQYRPRDREADIRESERILGFDTEQCAQPRTIDA